MSRQTETSLSKGCRTNMNLNKLSIVWRRYLLIVRVYCCRTVRTSVDPGASKPLSIITVADKLATYNLTCNHCLADKHSFFSERELTFTCAICCRPSVRLSVVCLSVVCNARAPYSGSCNFRNISTAFDTWAIHWHPQKSFRRSSQGNPSVGGVKRKA